MSEAVKTATVKWEADHLRDVLGFPKTARIVDVEMPFDFVDVIIFKLEGVGRSVDPGQQIIRTDLEGLRIDAEREAEDE